MSEYISLIPYESDKNWFRYGPRGSQYSYYGDQSIPTWVLQSEADLTERYKSAGIIPINQDGSKILLGSHLVEIDGRDAILWGAFAGGRNQGENHPADTAIREAKEELGVDILTYDLHTPMVLVNATKIPPNIPSYGVLFPVVLDESLPINLPSGEGQEIHSVKWFGYNDVMRILDDGYVSLWGGAYTWMFLNEWTTIRSQTMKYPAEQSVSEILRRIPGQIGTEIYHDTYLGPYHDIKAAGRS